MMPESMHSALLQPQLPQQWMQVLMEYRAILEWRPASRSKNQALRPALQVLLQHLHHIRLHVYPPGGVLTLRRPHLLVTHALIDADDIVREQHITRSQSVQLASTGTGLGRQFEQHSVLSFGCVNDLLDFLSAVAARVVLDLRLRGIQD